MTNLALEHALKRENIPFARAAVGDRYVVEMLHDKRWLYGGENSGHILALDSHTTGDGVVAALQVLAALREAGGTLKDLLSGLLLYPQKLINVAMAKGFPWKDDPGIQSALCGLRKKKWQVAAEFCCELLALSPCCASWWRVSRSRKFFRQPKNSQRWYVKHRNKLAFRSFLTVVWCHRYNHRVFSYLDCTIYA
jgi:hypothetical protein